MADSGRMGNAITQTRSRAFSFLKSWAEYFKSSFTWVTNATNWDVIGLVPKEIVASVVDKMYIKKINHTRPQLIYGTCHRPDFHKLSLTKLSAECSFKTHGRAFQTLDWVSQTIVQAFEALIENQELGREFENLYRVSVLQHGPCPISHGSNFTKFCIEINGNLRCWLHRL